MGSIAEKARSEPALVRTAAVIVAMVLAGLGVELGTENEALVETVIGSVLALIGGLATRQKVVPTEKLDPALLDGQPVGETLEEEDEFEEDEFAH